MSYYTRYNLETDPFQKQTRVPIYESTDYKEVHYRLDNLLIRNGFGLIMGAPGFRVIIVTVANSLGNIRVFELLPK